MYSKNFFAIHKEIVKILMYRDFLSLYIKISPENDKITLLFSVYKILYGSA